jgi:hypothetical protein
VPSSGGALRVAVRAGPAAVNFNDGAPDAVPRLYALTLDGAVAHTFPIGTATDCATATQDDPGVLPRDVLMQSICGGGGGARAIVSLRAPPGRLEVWSAVASTEANDPPLRRTWSMPLPRGTRVECGPPP